ncbi:B-type cyclin [Rhodotorula toruloides]
MSSAAGQPKLARPRRASRAPVRLGGGAGDENAPSAVSGAVPRAALAGKAVVAPIGKQAVQQVKGVQVATSQVAQGAQARRAFGDVSNAGGRTQVDRSSTVSVPVKPATRSRPPSAQGPPAPPQPPSSTGTGFGRLRIDANAQATAPAPPRAATAAVTGKARRAPSARAPVQPSAVAPAAPRLQQGEWPGAQSAFGGHAIKQAVNEHGVVPNVGLGLGSAAEAWMGDQMAVGRHYPQAGPSHAAGHKRTHDIEFSDEEEQQSAAYATHGHGHGHLHGALQHEDKVRVVEDDVEVGDGPEADGEMMVDPDDWLLQLCDEDEAVESERLVEEIKREFKEEIDYFDISMVAEYSDEIFEYMAELEEASMPNPRYMDHQSEIEWPMRATLIDWLLQVHMRYHMLPETLWIAVNIIDRFLSNRVVSLVKFQLVGVTAMFIASKYEEIMAPSVEEFVLMTENGYSREEILKGERIILQSLEFNISTYCSPYSWVRRISKADDYDIQTRTLSKFLMEVTLLDHRFLRARPSMIAAIGMYLARRMLGGDWNEAFIFFSGYTEAQLLVPAGFLLESIAAPGFEEKFCYKKYSSKKFLKASIFARNWAKQNAATEAA